MLLLLYLIIALKFIVPILMLYSPFVGAWGNYFLDVVDGDILLELRMSEYAYQTIDKIADYFSYIIMLIVGIRWRIKRLIIIFFIYRTIGQVLFFHNTERAGLFLFPKPFRAARHGLHAFIAS